MSAIELQTKVKRCEDFTITEKAPTKAFSWLKAPSSAFTLKTLLRHYTMHPNSKPILHSSVINMKALVGTFNHE